MKISGGLYRSFKQLADFFIGLIGTVLLVLPSYLIIFVIYKTKGYKGSIFFTQYRVGLNGKKFKIIKFRSMVENAEEILVANKKPHQKYIENSYKLPPDDKRFTRRDEFYWS